MTHLTPAQAEFVESVVRLEPRVATFDCDGTLWSGDAGEGFFAWELQQGLVSEEVQRWARSRYADYRAGKVPEEIMCGEMVTMHRGLREEVVQQAADAWFPQGIAPTIFPEMRALVRRLRDDGCDVWAVSSSNLWVIRAGMPYFEIPPDRILAAETAVENGTILDRLIRMPSGPGKSEAIREVDQRRARLCLRQFHLGPRDAGHVEAPVRHQPESEFEGDCDHERLAGLSAGHEPCGTLGESRSSQKT